MASATPVLSSKAMLKLKTRILLLVLVTIGILAVPVLTQVAQADAPPWLNVVAPPKVHIVAPTAPSTSAAAQI